MPIGKFKDFAALKRHLTAGRPDISDPDALTASVARKMEPDFDKKAARTRAAEAHKKHFGSKKG